MRAPITAMHRFGTHWLVTLQCGHKFTATAVEVALHQLYLGKRVRCEACEDTP